jgi:hypothetical protein
MEAQTGMSRARARTLRGDGACVRVWAGKVCSPCWYEGSSGKPPQMFPRVHVTEFLGRKRQLGQSGVSMSGVCGSCM